MGCGCSGSTHARQQNLAAPTPEEPVPAGSAAPLSGGPGYGQGYFWNGPQKTAAAAPSEPEE